MLRFGVYVWYVLLAKAVAVCTWHCVSGVMCYVSASVPGVSKSPACVRVCIPGLCAQFAGLPLYA